MDRCQIDLSGDHAAINGSLTIYTASEARRSLLGAPGRINLAGISSIDWAGAQVLIGLKQDARKAGRELVFEGHSEAVLRLFDLMGLVAWCGDRIKVPASLKQELSFRYGVRRRP